MSPSVDSLSSLVRLMVCLQLMRKNVEEYIVSIGNYIIVPCKYSNIGCKVRNMSILMKKHEAGSIFTLHLSSF